MTIQTIDLNGVAETGSTVINEEHQEAPPITPPTDTPGPDAADDIDTDELEALLVDLKETKKRNKAPPKKRVRKPKVVISEPEPVVEAAPVVEPILEVVSEPIAEQEQKPKRKYVRKPPVVPSAGPVAPEPALEPTKRSTLTMIDEMQRAERALRYQMRKNKMQTLVSQAF